MSRKEIFFIKIFIAIVVLGSFWFIFLKNKSYFEGYSSLSYIQSPVFISKSDEYKKNEGGEEYLNPIKRDIIIYVDKNGFYPEEITAFSGETVNLVLNSLDKNTHSLVFTDEILQDVILAVGSYGSDEFLVKNLQSGVYTFKSDVYAESLISGKLIVSNKDKDLE